MMRLLQLKKKCLRSYKQIQSLFKYIFIHGPNWIGSWEGLGLSDICSGLTKVNSVHWESDTSACEDLVDRKVHSSLIGVSLVAAAVSAYVCMQACMNAAFFNLYSKL